MSRRPPMPADVQQTAAQTPRPVGHPDPGSSAEAQPRPDQSLFRSQGFRSVFRAAAISTLGTQISFLAVPLLAVTALNATPAQLGILGALKTIAFPLITTPARPWPQPL